MTDEDEESKPCLKRTFSGDEIQIAKNGEILHTTEQAISYVILRECRAKSTPYLLPSFLLYESRLKSLVIGELSDRARLW